MTVGRRLFLKLLLGLSGIMALLPFGSYSSYLSFKPEVTIKNKRIANISQILPASAQYFVWPTNLDILTRDPTGNLRAYSALCTHAGCQLSYQPESEILTCGCHGSMFDATSGKVIQGPAATPLTAIKLEVDKDGEIYATGFAGED